MPRYKLTLEYDGSRFAGWQKQADRPSIQQTLEEAVHKFCGEAVEVVGAGRTDAGVHASGQVAHVDLPRQFTPFQVMMGINFHLRNIPENTLPLGAAIAITAAEPVPVEFHARFSATKRHYVYRILNRRAPAALDTHVWHVPETLDADSMHRAAQLLVGRHDFTSFRDSQCQAKSPLKTLERIEVARYGEEIHFRLSARSFLHHQVRIIVGTLALVGKGKWTERDVAKALAATDRRAGGPTAPPEGLCLVGVEYEG